MTPCSLGQRTPRSPKSARAAKPARSSKRGGFAPEGVKSARSSKRGGLAPASVRPLGGLRPRPPVGVARAVTGTRRSALSRLGLVFLFLACPPVRGGDGVKSKLPLGLSVVRVLARLSASPAR